MRKRMSIEEYIEKKPRLKKYILNHPEEWQKFQEFCDNTARQLKEATGE